MSSLSYSLSHSLGILLASQLPISSYMQITIGTTCTALLQFIFQSIGKYAKVPEWIYPKQHKLIINRYLSNDKTNPLFIQLENYILDKYEYELTQAPIQPKHGIFKFGLTKDTKFNKILKDNFNDNIVYLTFGYKSKTMSDDNNTYNNYKHILNDQIMITSKNLNLNILKTYLQNICVLDCIREIQVYKSTKVQEGRNNICMWSPIQFTSNKTFKNTIISEQAHTEFVQDIRTFIKNEQWYTSKGIDYKRGYILHGPPGTISFFFKL